MKRFLSMLLILALTLAFVPAASAATVTTDEASETLVALGLLSGTGDSLELNRTPTRNEILVMLIRLMGLEDEALSYTGATGFTDAVGTWAERYVAYAENNGLANGISDTQFGGSNSASVRDYLTLVLRALGYTEGTDFFWGNSISFADSVGLTHGEYNIFSEFTREDMVLISYTALTLKLKDTDTVLVEKLYEDGTVSYSQLVSTRLSGHVNYNRESLTASEIYEKCSSAVFTMKVYESDTDYDIDDPDGTASGFFITSDGIALISYHSIDDMQWGTATTTDGHVYMIESILYYDTFRDFAVAKISQKSLDGTYATYFPYIELGDSDAANTGSTVYVIGSPIGLENTFSSGIVSNSYRIVDDPLYPCLQITAPLSQGSSGGVVLNEYGEAIGIVYAMYSSGNDLNLAVPINTIGDIPLSGDGETISEICDDISYLKEIATITASETDITLAVGESITLDITSDCPVAFAAKFRIVGDSVSCYWGDFTTKTSTTLTIKGTEEGESDVIITFTDGTGNEDFKLTISVKVTD